jgi:hypothetical protein
MRGGVNGVDLLVVVGQVLEVRDVDAISLALAVSRRPKVSARRVKTRG